MSNNNRNNKDTAKEEKSSTNKNSYKGKNNKNRRGNSSRGNKPKDYNPNKDKPIVVGLEKGDRDNDPNWYFESKEIAEQVMNYSFETVMGMEPVTEYEQVPTVATIFMNPSPGCSYSVDNPGQYQTADLLPTTPNLGFDGANFMAAKLYTMLSAYSGRNAQYQPNDILVAILAQSSILEAIESLRRCFGLVYTYSVFNRSIPRKLIEALGIDFDDFTTNLADYRAELNYQISRINQLPIFGNIAYVNKSMELYQRIYYDEENTPYAQLIQYAPASLWQLDEQTYSTGSVLKTVEWFCELYGTFAVHRSFQVRATKIPMSTLLTTLGTMISELLNSTTLNLVFMDLIHLASKVSGIKFMMLDYVSETYGVTPTFDRTFMLQFHNLRIMGNNYYYNSTSTTPIIQIGTSGLYTTQLNDVATDPNTGRIFYNPSIVDDTAWHSMDNIIDFDAGNPSLEDRVEAQRFTSIRTNYHWSDTNLGSGRAFYICNLLPDHYALFITIDSVYQPNSGYTGFDQRIVTLNKMEIDSQLTSSTLANVKMAESMVLRAAHALTKFKNAPYLHVCMNNDFFASIGDLNYFTRIPFYKQARMNQIMYSGLFAFRA